MTSIDINDSTMLQITTTLHMLDQRRQEKCHTNNSKFIIIKSTMTQNQHRCESNMVSSYHSSNKSNPSIKFTSQVIKVNQLLQDVMLVNRPKQQ